jgi:CheY-like chemotaxis protein
MKVLTCSTTSEIKDIFQEINGVFAIVIDLEIQSSKAKILGVLETAKSKKCIVLACNEIAPIEYSRFISFNIKSLSEYQLIPEKLISLSKSNNNKDIKILIDEDDKVNQKVIECLLNNIGFTNITIVEDGYEAIERLKIEGFDLILIDIKTPRVDGYGVLDFVIESVSPRPACVALTAFVSNIRDYKKRGFDDCIFKPISFDLLKEVMFNL